MVKVGPVSRQYPQCILMDAAHYVEPASRQIDAQYQTGRTAVVIRAILNNFSALNRLPNISQSDAALIKPCL